MADNFHSYNSVNPGRRRTLKFLALSCSATESTSGSEGSVLRTPVWRRRQSLSQGRDLPGSVTSVSSLTAITQTDPARLSQTEPD